MAKPIERKTAKVLNPKPLTPALLNTPAGRFAPDWDSPNAKIDRTKQQSKPSLLEKGGPGVK